MWHRQGDQPLHSGADSARKAGSKAATVDVKTRRDGVGRTHGRHAPGLASTQWHHRPHSGWGAVGSSPTLKSVGTADKQVPCVLWKASHARVDAPAWAPSCVRKHTTGTPDVHTGELSQKETYQHPQPAGAAPAQRPAQLAARGLLLYTGACSGKIRASEIGSPDDSFCPLAPAPCHSTAAATGSLSVPSLRMGSPSLILRHVLQGCRWI